MEYVCMSFGWFQELLKEERVPNFAAAEAKVVEMLDAGGMIAHGYRESNLDQPELVGRNRTFRSFMAAQAKGPSAHEVERYLLDRGALAVWQRAAERDGVIENRWQVVDLSREPEAGAQPVFGKATRMAGGGAGGDARRVGAVGAATPGRAPGLRD